MTRSPASAALSALRPALLVLGLAGPAQAQVDPAPPGRRGGDMLDIPGLPPIPLPPGARAFTPKGPGVDDQPAPPSMRPRRPSSQITPLRPERGDPAAAGRDDKKQAERVAPHSTPTQEEQRGKVLDALHTRLKAADDAEDAKGVAAAIERVWQRSGSDTADLLMTRAVAAVAGDDYKTAESLLDSVVLLEPEWAEGWNRRAMVRFHADNIDGAMSDLEHALKIEPRHFVALAGLGAILHKSGLDKRALDAYRRALDLYPQQPDIRKSVEKLQIDVEGRDI
ncbi:MAG: hypothetical protein V9G24_18230 [Rhodoblastus sp.]|jgi:tetratricopeptide (TPR) repeat protein